MADSWTGGVVYTQNLVRAIASLPVEKRNQIKLSVGVQASNLKLVEPISRFIDQVYPINFWHRAYLKISKLIADKASFIPPNILNINKFNFVYPDLAGLRCPYPWGGCIYDFQHYHLPQFFSQEEIESRNKIAQRIAEAAPVIILISQIVQEDFNYLYPEAASRSTVMHPITCSEPEWFQLEPKVTQEKYGLPDYFFLVSNQFWQHKNHGIVIESLGLLKQQGIKPTVVCTGNITDYRHPEYYSQLLVRIEELELGGQVRILGLIPRIDQIQLMRRCLAVIQPSLFEGWGIVVEDARTLGKSILLSDLPVHREHNYQDSYFFEKSNSEELATLISTALCTFKPGPDLEKETLAKQENVQRVAAYGRRFLEIVNSVI